MRNISTMFYFLLLLYLLEAVRSNVDKVKLRVTVPGERLTNVPTCRHAMSQVEMANLHNTETIQIHSVQLVGEQTVIVSDDKKQHLIWDDSLLPQQIHVSRLPSGSLSLAPGQVALASLVFLPRYPQIAQSPTAMADARMYGLPLQNLDGGGHLIHSMEVNTKVVVDTSRGIVELPIKASSIRQNEYALPDLIYFGEDTSAPKDTTNANEVVIEKVEILDTVTFAKSNEPPDKQKMQQTQQQQTDCYDLYFFNPSKDEAVEIMDITVSHPDLVGLKVNPDLIETEPSFFVQRHLSTSSQVLRLWSDDGPLTVIPQTKSYVGTVCSEPVKREVSVMEEFSYWEMSHSMGFLQVRTAREMLYIALEERHRMTVSPTLNMYESMGELLATSSSIDFHLLSSSTPVATAGIGLRNTSPKKMSIMRATVGMQTIEDDNWLEKIGLQINVTMATNPGQTHLQIPKRTTLQEVIWLTATVDWDAVSSHDLDSISFHGTLVIRATTLDHQTWHEVVRRNPLAESEYIVEVPLFVSIVQGKLGIMIHRTSHPFPHLWSVKPWRDGLASVSSIFYPDQAFEIMGEFEGDQPEPIFSPDGIDYKLRIFTNLEKSLSLASAEVIDPDDSNDSGCDRFRITLGTAPNGEFPFPGFADVGMLSIHYDFDAKNQYESNFQYSSTPIYPTTCSLIIKTAAPLVEVHRIPLIIYPGQLDVTGTTASPIPTNRKEENETHTLTSDSDDSVSQAVVGYDVLLSWFKGSSAGSVLKSVLETQFKERKKKSDVQLLGKYIHNICKNSVDIEPAKLRPVLLRVGAIEQGEMETASFFFTNHNPIPLMVSVDVGEVEGMSVSLARVATTGNADGNNLLNYFPMPSDDNARTVVPKGIWEGHPMKGLRKFLKTDKQASSFFSQFSYRDAISLSEKAVRRQPVLGMLYNKYAFGEFHRHPLPIRFTKNGWSRCGLSPMHPAKYGALNETNLDGRLGPLILSADGTVLHSLKTCWDKKGEPEQYSSDGTYVIVPPGGQARFELRLHAPSSKYLKDDITRFLATGLVLTTDHGEVLPIFVTFEALQGKLQVSHAPLTNNGKAHSDTRFFCRSKTKPPAKQNSNKTVISVPAGLFGHPASEDNNTIVTIPPDQSNCSVLAANNTELGHLGHPGVSLFVKSSFSRDVRLLKMSSCNPWFEVDLQATDQQSSGQSSCGLNVGTIKSKVLCDSGANSSAGRYPSFYQCALNWLSHRSDLQLKGCGLLPSSKDKDVAQVAERNGIERAIQAFERALLLSRWMYGSRDASNATGIKDSVVVSALKNLNKNGKTNDGFVSPVILDVFAEAWDAWRAISEFGIRVLSSSLRATIEYDSVGTSDFEAEWTDAETTATQNLSVSMRDLEVETVLSTPRLFDCRRARSNATFGTDIDGADVDEDEPSWVEFPSALVTNFVSVKIPLRNPTSVPVRVRLAAAPPQILENEAGDIANNEFAIDQNIRRRYIKNHEVPYIQNGKFNASSAGDSKNLWWDGGGAFFLSNFQGDLIRSHHNIKIRAGAGAQVSLVNPSLHSSSAFLVGCGVRCGIRDDPGMPQSSSSDTDFDAKLISPFGASAAAGVTLVGTKRSNSPQTVGTEEPYVHAGASLPEMEGPPAFAIPYSALDEIVIPPHGKGEIGPVFFRPPGRYSMHGCDVALDKQTTQIGTKQSEACKTNYFSSMVFLENSLTGLERIALRGRALWERVIFLDPLPKHGDENFGDIELRNGRSALVFSGSRANDEERDAMLNLLSESHVKASNIKLKELAVSASVVKEVVVHNAGDIIVDFARVYLTDSARINQRRFFDTFSGIGSACKFGSFRILNCWEVEEDRVEIDGHLIHNVRQGFILHPGKNFTLLIEHIPNCLRPEEFVSLNFDFRRRRRRKGSVDSFDGNGVYALSRSGGLRQARANNWKNSFRQRKVDMLIGYDMSEEQFRSCKPSHQRPRVTPIFDPLGHPRYSYGKVGNDTSQSVNFWACTAESHICTLNHIGGFDVGTLLSWFITFVMSSFFALLSVTIALIARGYLVRLQASLRFSATLKGVKSKLDGSESAAHQPPPGTQSNWSAAFRCLARADPTSSELQALGREQTRQVVLGRYRSMGVLAPQCFNSAGVFQRERPGSVNSPRRQIHGKEGSMGNNERVRMLSDAIFQNFSTNNDGIGTGIVPCGLGWRAAFSRGVINRSSFNSSKLELRTNELLRERSNANKKAVQAVEVSDSSEQSDEDSDNYRESDSVGDYSSEPDELEDNGEHQVQSEPAESGDVISTSNSEGTDTNKEEVATAESRDNRAVKDIKPAGEVIEAKVENMSTPAEISSAKTPTRTSHETMHASKPRTVTTNSKLPIEAPSNGPVRKQNQTKDTRSKRNDSRTAQASNRTKGVQEKARVSDRKGNNQRNKESNQVAKESFKDRKTTGAKEPNKEQRSTVQDANSTRKKRTPKMERTTKKQTKETVSVATPSSSGKNKPVKAFPKKEKVKPGFMPASPISPQLPSLINEEHHMKINKTESPVLRPPPGLAPPPGFGAADANPSPALPLSLNRSSFGGSDHLLSAPTTTTTSSLLNNESSLLSIPATTTTPAPISGTATNLGPLTSNVPGATPGPVGSPLPALGDSSGFGMDLVQPLQPVAAEPLLEDNNVNNMTGFDVMDFLDSILNDGSASNEENLNPTAIASATFLPEATSGLPLSSDPWATERTSRAAAYGIAFEDTAEEKPAVGSNQQGENKNESDPLVLPLLTSQVITSTNVYDEDDDHAMSFFTSLPSGFGDYGDNGEYE